MENLHIKTGYPLSKKIILGGGLILLAVIMLILNIAFEIKFMGGWIPLFLIGVLIFTPLMSSYNIQIKAGRELLEINWPDRAKINVLESEINRITLTAKHILIFRKVRKTIKLTLLDKDQKTQVFKFFTEYAKEKNLTLVNEEEK